MRTPHSDARKPYPLRDVVVGENAVTIFWKNERTSPETVAFTHDGKWARKGTITEKQKLEEKK